MQTWFTSDTHFGHKMLPERGYRPFKNVKEMNETIINNFNEDIAPEDHTIFLGDVVLGGYQKNLPLISEINGSKTLVVGNHDKPFQIKNQKRFREVVDIYKEHFDYVFTGSVSVSDDDYNEYVLSHFPYDGDHTDEERFVDHRPEDLGVTLIHGHTHDAEVVTYSKNGTLQIHVGVDAHDFRPVPLDVIKAIREKESDYVPVRF